MKFHEMLWIFRNRTGRLLPVIICPPDRVQTGCGDGYDESAPTLDRQRATIVLSAIIYRA